MLMLIRKCDRYHRTFGPSKIIFALIPNFSIFGIIYSSQKVTCPLVSKLEVLMISRKFSLIRFGNMLDNLQVNGGFVVPQFY